jgi:hypothetical protein
MNQPADFNCFPNLQAMIEINLAIEKINSHPFHVRPLRS